MKGFCFFHLPKKTLEYKDLQGYFHSTKKHLFFPSILKRVLQYAMLNVWTVISLLWNSPVLILVSVAFRLILQM